MSLCPAVANQTSLVPHVKLVRRFHWKQTNTLACGLTFQVYVTEIDIEVVSSMLSATGTLRLACLGKAEAENGYEGFSLLSRGLQFLYRPALSRAFSFWGCCRIGFQVASEICPSFVCDGRVWASEDRWSCGQLVCLSSLQMVKFLKWPGGVPWCHGVQLDETGETSGRCESSRPPDEPLGSKVTTWLIQLEEILRVTCHRDVHKGNLPNFTWYLFHSLPGSLIFVLPCSHWWF